MKSISEFTEEILSMAYTDKSEHIRNGQAVFNYIESTYGGVAREVQFIDNIDCFYNDDYILPFINAVYKRLSQIDEILEKERRDEEIRKHDPSFLRFDFQGWPITKKTLRQLLISLGADMHDNKLSFDINNPILDIYPECLEDDGMAYGINKMYFTDIDIIEDKDKQKRIYFWRDKSVNKIEK